MTREQGSSPEQHEGAFSWPAFVLVFCALMLPAGLWLLESDRRQADTRLEMHADQARIELQRRLRQQESVLRAIVAYVQVNPGFHADDFDALVALLIDNYPHIRSVHMHQLVGHADRDAFEVEMRARGQAGYVIVESAGVDNGVRPASSRDRYLPVSFVAPLDGERDRRLLGLDLLEEPMVRETVNRALEHGMAAGPVAIPMRASDAGYFLVRDMAFDGVLGGGARALMSIAAHSGQLLPAAVRPPGVKVWLEGPGLAQTERPAVDTRSRFPLGLTVVAREVEVGNQVLRMIMQRERGWRDLNSAPLLLLLGLALLGSWGGGSSWGQRQYYRRQAGREHQRQGVERRRAQAVAAAVSDAIIVADADNGIVAFNPAAAAMTGWRREDALGCTPDEVVRLRSSEGVPINLAAALPPDADSSPDNSGYLLLARSDGVDVPVRLHRVGLQADDSASDILLLEATESGNSRDVWPLAGGDLDPLTGLPGRQHLWRHMEAIRADARQLANSVVMVVGLPDLSGLREYYDNAGADELLRLAGRILDARRRSEDLLARIDDSHFGLVLHDCRLADGRKVAADILEALRECHFSSADGYLQAVPCIGLALLDADPDVFASLEQAIQAAAAAAQKPGRIVCYDPGNKSAPVTRQGRQPGAQRLLEALEEQRFELHAQPVMDLATNPPTVHHYEILLRLRDEQGRQLAPADFLPLAEREQLMGKLDRWVLEQAVAWLGTQARQQRPMLAINLSALTLSDSELVPWLKHSLVRQGVAGQSLRFELKESVAAARPGSVGGVMDELRRDGVSFCLDNFGTGPNGFLPLRHLQFEALKIDAALMQAAGRDINEAAIIEAICHVARVRGMQVVAEGVADADTLGVVRQLGIHFAQGNHLGEPEPLNPR